MSDEEILNRIRSMWSQKDSIRRDIDLATVAIRLHPNLLEIIPATAFPHSKWKMSQQYLLDTSAANTMRLTGLAMIVAIGVAAWLFFFTSLSWYVGLGLAVGVIVLTMKLQQVMSRAAIFKGVTESAFVFTKLWELQAFALRVNGKVYEPTSNRNAWQDVVFLALELNDLIANKPLTRQEMLEEVLSSIKKPA